MSKRTVPFGYQLPHTQVMLMQSESDIIYAIFENYKNGKSLNEIAAIMNRQPIRYYGDDHKWDRHIILAVLRNEIYKGNEHYPMIVDEDTFDMVQKLIFDKGHRISPEEKPYARIFKNKMRCSACGSEIKRRAGAKGKQDKVKMRCSNPECDCNKNYVYQINVEDTIKNLLTGIASGTVEIDCKIPQAEKMDEHTEITKRTNELRFIMQNPDTEPERIIDLIRQIGAERFEACRTGDMSKLTEYIKKIVNPCLKQERIAVDVIDNVIKRIILSPESELTVILINGRTFTERMA